MPSTKQLPGGAEMPKASEVAAELRKLADSIDRLGDTNIERPYVMFASYGKEDKDKFMAVSKSLPHPLKKEWGKSTLKNFYSTPAMYAYATIPREHACRLISPAIDAIYECEPILSREEVSELEQTHAE